MKDRIDNREINEVGKAREHQYNVSWKKAISAKTLPTSSQAKKADVYQYSVMLNACADSWEAEALMDRMAQAGIKPSEVPNNNNSQTSNLIIKTSIRYVPIGKNCVCAKFLKCL